MCKIFIESIIPIINMIIGFLGLASIIFLFWQIRENRLFTKLSAAYNSFDIDSFSRICISLNDNLKNIGIVIKDNSFSLTEEQINNIKEDSATSDSIFTYLSYAERICTGYNIGYLDKKVIYKLYGSSFKSLYNIFKPIIEKYRCKFNRNTLFQELGDVVKEWETKGK